MKLSSYFSHLINENNHNFYLAADVEDGSEVVEQISVPKSEESSQKQESGHNDVNNLLLACASCSVISFRFF